jgi:hypothetical protein
LFAKNDRVNFGLSFPSMRPISNIWFSKFMGLLAARFEVVHSNSYFIVLKARAPVAQ